MDGSKRIIRLSKSARKWDDGLPIGNGRLGGMVMGKVEEELVHINEETIWYGSDKDRKNPDTKANVYEIRQLLLEGKVQQAQFLARMSMTSTPKYMNPYQPAGDMRICFYDHKFPATDYAFALDLNRALVSLSYRMDGCLYEREYLTSHKYQVLAVRLKTDGKKKLTFSVNMSRKPFEEKTGTLDACTVFNSGECGPGGVHYITAVRLAAKGAPVETMGDFVYVEEADEAVIYVAAATDYTVRDGVPMVSGAEDPLKEPRRLCLERLDNAEKAGFEKIRREHEEEYTALFGRMDLWLDTGVRPQSVAQEENSVPAADRMVEAVRAGKPEYEGELTQLLFHFARYLMISSSYDCLLPSNLQGIWNGEYAPPWQSEFTININEEMNYWIAEKCNLPECHEPLFAQVERMVPKGRETARKLYGCEGFCAHHNTNLWANTDPEGIFEASPFWPMGAAWLCLHFYEHYAFTQDVEFLRDRAMPIMWEAIAFFKDYLYHTEDGYYVTGPSLSPENTYRSKVGQVGSLCMGPSMDIQILRELLTDYLNGAKALEKAGDGSGAEISAEWGQTTEDIHGQRIQTAEKIPIDRIQTAEDILKHLPPQKLTSDGRIMEWQEEYEETEPGHRHISHLFGLHPGSSFTEETPEYFAAAKKTLETRLANGGGHTGWSRAWIICFYARLKEGQKVEENIRSMLKTCIKNNLLDTHPPFQIDGNFGLAEGILESLAQSHAGYLEFLPALPKGWKRGGVRGLVLRGAVTADFTWEEGRLTSLVLETRKPCEVEIRFPGCKQSVSLCAGRNVIV